MKNILHIINCVFLAAAFALCSCDNDRINDKLDDIEERIASIEEAVSKINDNIITANKLYRKNILITSYKLTSYGYDLTLSSGETLSITFGDQLEGVAPIISIDEYGKWVISIDGGENFTEIEGVEDPGAKDGYTPIVNVDKYGFWIISKDGGSTWERILNEAGDPISAKDGKAMNGSYKFFQKVTFNEDTYCLDIILVGGHTLSIPVYREPSITMEYYYDYAYAYAGKEESFPIKMTNVDEAAWIEIPDGWAARLEENKLCVTAPEGAPAGDYVLKLLAHTKGGAAKVFPFTFRYEPDLIFKDDFNGNDIDHRYWERYKGGTVRSDWDRYTEGDTDHTFVENGYLRMTADVYEDTYRCGAVRQWAQTSFIPPFRIDCSAQFTQMATGVWYAIWACPVEGYNWGEIDIMEKANYGTLTQHSTHSNYTIHTHPSRQDQPNSGYGNCNPGVYNVYSVTLTEEAVTFYINDVEVFRYNNIEHSVNDPGYDRLLDIEKEYYLQNFTHIDCNYRILIDIAINGAYPGKQAIPEELPGIFDIDWISVKKL